MMYGDLKSMLVELKLETNHQYSVLDITSTLEDYFKCRNNLEISSAKQVLLSKFCNTTAKFILFQQAYSLVVAYSKIRIVNNEAIYLLKPVEDTLKTAEVHIVLMESLFTRISQALFSETQPILKDIASDIEVFMYAVASFLLPLLNKLLTTMGACGYMMDNPVALIWEELNGLS